ncbi:hypothetical protein DFH06DRAFT_1188180 [Mycena polygramma]|nr:hypothetical protein DFH06DRAFT_1188180 [Mycena polygramma]
MDVLQAHPELAPELFQVVSNALTTAQHRILQLEQQLAATEQTGTQRTSDNSGGHLSPPECCQDKDRKILKIESDPLQLQRLKDSEMEKLREGKDTAERVLETKENEFKALTADFERERKMGSELRTALEEHYLSIRTVESELEEKRRTYDRDLQDLTAQKEACSLNGTDYKRTLEEIQGRYAAVVAEKDALQEKHRETLAALASKNHSLVRTVETKQAEFTTLEQRFQALSKHTSASTAQSKSLFKEALSASNAKVVAKQQEIDKLANDSNARINALEEKLHVMEEHLSAAESGRMQLSRQAEIDSAQIRNLELDLQDTVERKERLRDRMYKKLEAADSALKQVHDQLSEDLERSQMNEKRLEDENRALRERERTSTQHKACHVRPWQANPLYNGQMWSSRGTPYPRDVTPESERASYLKCMYNLEVPVDRPRFYTISSIGRVSDTETAFVHHGVDTDRRSVYFPQQTTWCTEERVHALLFAPTHELREQGWRPSQVISSLFLSKDFDLFVSAGTSVFYAGIYRVKVFEKLSTRPTYCLPDDVSPDALCQAAGLSRDYNPGPSGNGVIPTACFGLQCVGFDVHLYATLYRRIQTSGSDNSLKRKASSGDDTYRPRKKA